MQQAKAARREQRAAAAEQEKAMKNLAASETLSVRQVCCGVVAACGSLHSLAGACACRVLIKVLQMFPLTRYWDVLWRQPYHAEGAAARSLTPCPDTYSYLS